MGQEESSADEMARANAAFVCACVFERASPILLVVREGGDWMFLCGETHETSDLPRLMHRAHLEEWDGTVRDVLDLAEGWEAERAGVGLPWQRHPVTNE